MHKPWHSLVFGVVVFSMLGLLSFTFPENGITISKNLNLNFPGLNSILGLNSAKKDISKIIEAVDAIDTSFTVNDPEDLQQSDSSGKVSEKIDDKKKCFCTN